MMDSNSPVTDSKIQEFALYLNLIYPLEGRKWENTPTFDRGSSRIGLILVHRDLTPSVTSSEIVPSSVYQNTDHSAVLLRFNEAKLFGNEQETISPRRGIFLKSKKRKKTEAYLEKVRPSVEKRNIQGRLNKLLGIPPNQWIDLNENDFNSIDDQITNIMTESEQQLSQHNVQRQWFLPDRRHISGNKQNRREAFLRDRMNLCNSRRVEKDIKMISLSEK